MQQYAVKTEDLEYEDIHDITHWTYSGFLVRQQNNYFYVAPADTYHTADSAYLQELNPEYISKSKFLLLKLLGFFPRINKEQ